MAAVAVRLCEAGWRISRPSNEWSKSGAKALIVPGMALVLALAIFAAAPRAAAQGPTASEVRVVTPAEERVREALQSWKNPPRPWADSGENWAKHPLGGQLAYHMHRAEEGTSFKVTIELNSSGRDKYGVPTRGTRTGDVSVTLHISGAGYGGDAMFSIVGGKTVTIPAGQSSVDVLIEAKDDSVYRWTNLSWGILSIANITKAAGDNAALNPTPDNAAGTNFVPGYRGVRIGVYDNDPQPDKHPATIAQELGAACNDDPNAAACKALLNNYPDAPTDLRATAAPDGKKRDPEAEEQTVIVVEPPKIVVIIDGEDQEPEQQQDPPKQEPAEEAPAQPRAEPTEEAEPQQEDPPGEENPPGVPDGDAAEETPPQPSEEPRSEPTPEPNAEEKLIAEIAGDDGCVSQDERLAGATRIQKADLTTIDQSQAYRMFRAAYC